MAAVTGSRVRDLNRAALRLVGELHEFGIGNDPDEGELLTDVLMLDALACAGLALVEDEDGVAPIAFHTRLPGVRSAS